MTDRPAQEALDAIHSFAISIIEIADREEAERATPDEERAATRYLAEQVIAYTSPLLDAAPQETLDVERLARAMCVGGYGLGEPGTTNGICNSHREQATRIATEYARPASPAPPQRDLDARRISRTRPRFPTADEVKGLAAPPEPAEDQ